MSLELRDLTPDERGQVQQRFDALASRRFAPTPRNPRFEVWWPRAPLDARAFPAGIQSRDEESGFNEAARLRGFMNQVCDGEFFIADLSTIRPFFRHAGRYDEDLCRWIKTRLVANHTCLMASNSDVLLIGDQQLGYSVVGGPPDTLELFERRFGGGEALKATFVDYVDQWSLGSGEDDRKWAHDNLVKWSGWS